MMKSTRFSEDAMDEADRGNETMEKWLLAQLEEHAYQMSHTPDDWPYGLGRCKNCGDETGEERRAYCCPECAQDHWDRLKSEKRNGKYRGG